MATSPSADRGRSFIAQHRSFLLLGGLWLTIFFASLFAPPVLDDADATHAGAARHIVESGDWVTLRVNDVRYLEKAPLPYWITAISFRLFGFNTFAVHLPLALGVLLLALLGYHWADRAFGDRAALYTGLFVVTSTGVFLFTRWFIPEVLLSLFLALALYSLLRALEDDSPPVFVYIIPFALACAVLTKGLVALVFFFGTAAVYLTLTGDYRRWRRLRPISGTLLFLLIAAPWHILAGLRNRGGMNGHGFFWFYFVNEHFLRFLGKRIPMDYNKLPAALYWSLHLVWLFPWSLFLPLVLVLGWRKLRATHLRSGSFAQNTSHLLAIYAAIVLVFFSLSTNQEYYTFPAYLPLLLLTAAALVRAEDGYANIVTRRCLAFAHAAFAAIGIAAAATLCYGLWTSRHLPFVADIGDLLAHRAVGDYTLSMSHFFDLTGPSFAALRLPAALAAIALALGPALAWCFRIKHRHLAAILTVAITSSVFLIAAHLAFIRFAPMLSSQDFVDKIEELEDDRLISRDNQVLLYGDQAYGSSIPFYLGDTVDLVDGRSTSLLFGSTFPDAPSIFLTPGDLLAHWGSGPRKILFVPLERRDEVDRLLGSRQVLLEETSGKTLITDRPLDPAPLTPKATMP